MLCHLVFCILYMNYLYDVFSWSANIALKDNSNAWISWIYCITMSELCYLYFKNINYINKAKT